MVLRGLGGAASTNPHNRNKVRYVIPIVIAAFALLALFTIHEPTKNIQYVGSPDRYQGFVPHDTINYNGHIDPKGDLILDNGTVIHNAMWHGKYSDTIVQNHDKIVQLNNRFVRKIDPITHQPYVTLQDFYVIKGQVPIMQVTINGQTYYVIDANKINEANIAGFYTYDKWVNNFVVAMNTPGTYAAGLPGNSPVFQWENITGALPYQIILYNQNSQNFAGGGLLVLPNRTIIPYGVAINPSGISFSNFTAPSQIYNLSS